ncbi:hypothetical protein [Chryseolinea sp. H1M3-3]|uniref:hypothetical protein n=1 Tax=Chryseolinea sp. H1M3-3 TaxID=3034144 RepID=UPI0023EC2A00|nr:hypothetical protein [Chryseolinea sp. H1M3-3]
MNFINPYVTIYADDKAINQLPFCTEVIWTFLKNIDNRLKLFQHRLNIYISESEEPKRISKFGSIYEYRTKLARPFHGISEFEKRNELLNLIFEAFDAVGREHKWAISVVRDAYSKSITQLGTFEYLTESKLNRRKKLSGQLKLNLNGRTLIFNAEINHMDNNFRKSYELLLTDEYNFSWNRMFREFGWYDNQRFGLKFLSGDLWIVINTEDGQFEEILNPKKFDLKKIEKYLLDLKKFIKSG